MAFTPKLFDDLPAGTPDVLIIFHGQMLLRSDGSTCEVGVNPIAAQHVLSIEARMKRPGSTDRIHMRHLGPLHFRPSEGLSISVAGNMAPPKAFKMVTLDPINYEAGTGSREDDFRWILNLEGGLFHGADLNPAIFPTQNVIRLHEGQYYFRTAVRSEPRYQYRRINGGKDPFVFRTIGAIASASVFLEENQGIVMKWQDGTQERDRVLTLSKAPDTVYEIYIENTPLFRDPPREADLPNLDELVEYYKVIPQIPPTPARRFKLVPELFRGGGELGSPDVPCQVMTLDDPGN